MYMNSGGGNRENDNLDRSRPPLRWMVNEAGKLGLRTARFERELSSKEQIEITESLSGLWWILEWLPIKRLTFSRKIGCKLVTRRRVSSIMCVLLAEALGPGHTEERHARYT